MSVSTCPDPEQLAACAEGRLEGEERAQVLAHLRACADCYEVFVETLRFLDDDVAMEWDSDTPADGSGPSPGAGVPHATTRRGSESAPKGRVLPFPGRSLRRLAAVALPLAAVVLLGVALWPSARFGVATTTPTRAQASPPPSPLAPSGPPPLRLAGGAPEYWTQPPPPMAVGGAPHASPAEISCLAGLSSADIDVALLRESAELDQRLGWAARYLDEAGASKALLAHFERLDRQALLAAGRMPPPAGLVEPDWYAVGRALEIVRLAGRAADLRAMEHPDVEAGWAAARRRGLDLAALAARVRGGDEARRLADEAERLLKEACLP